MNKARRELLERLANDPREWHGPFGGTTGQVAEDLVETGLAEARFDTALRSVVYRITGSGRRMVDGSPARRAR